jgi:diguanylate cyclase (GGDEF)-like protein
VRSRTLLDPARRSRTRRVGAVLAGTLVVLMSAAVLGAWSQARLLDQTSQASAETTQPQVASQLVAHEQYLLQAAVADPFHAEASTVRDIQPTVIDTLQQLARGSTDDASSFRDVLDQERLFQQATSDILSDLEQGKRAHALATIERLENLMSEIRTTLVDAANAHAAENAHKIDQATHRSHLLSTGTIVLFLFGLLVLGAAGWISRSDRRMIERMAAEDALTGLPNRTAFAAHAQHALRDAERTERHPTVLMVDLDGFKDVNDTLGHAVGDLLLVEVAQRLRTCVRENDIVARLGGDEFAFLLQGGAPSVGEDTAERIAAALARPFVIHGVALDIEASVGITTALAGQDVTDVVRDADVAMYIAKENNFGYSRFEAKHADGATTRVTLMGSIRRALDAGEIVLHYQPKIEVGTGRLIGAEALARWQHPTRGLLPPSEFIPVLERTSLVHPFNSYVLTHALKQARKWMDNLYPIPIAVNVTARCLLDPGFPEEVAQSLLAAGVPGELLCIEITEGTIIANPESTIDVLRRVRSLGVKTSIDDFGTGYASMANLKILPVDEVKVDRSFVHDMAMGGTDEVMVGSAIALGHNLGLTVVAEGVEDRATLDALEHLGCDVAQGYYFAQALDPATFSSWVRAYSTVATTEVS